MSRQLPAEPRVLLLVGPKGSGKTFLGTLVARELGIPFLHVEQVFIEAMRGSRSGGMSLDEEGYARVLAAVEAILRRGPVVVLESTGVSGVFPAFLSALRAQFRVTLVAVRAPLDRCLERVRTRDERRHILVSDRRVQEINEQAVAVRLPWDLEIDNGGPAAPESVVRQFRDLLAATPAAR
jgi:shikimate kinase